MVADLLGSHLGLLDHEPGLRVVGNGLDDLAGHPHHVLQHPSGNLYLRKEWFLSTGGTYYVPYSFLLISNKFCNGGAAQEGRLSSFKHLSDPSMAIKFLYAPAPPPPTVWALKPPSWALVHKTTYTPMIYTALCIMFWMRAYPFLGQVGGGLALEITNILGPKWDSPISLIPFHRDNKLSISRAQPPPTYPHNGYASVQNLMHGAA